MKRELMKLVEEMRESINSQYWPRDDQMIDWADRIEAITKAQTPSADVLVEALRRIASFKPKGPYDGDGYREWNRAGEYAATIARNALDAYDKERSRG